MTRHTCTGDVETCRICYSGRDAIEWGRVETDDRAADDAADRMADGGWL